MNAKRARGDIQVRPCRPEELTNRSKEIANLYMRVFAGPPWYEKYLVEIDGKTVRMGTPTEETLLAAMKKSGAVKASDIRPFYTEQEVVDDIIAVSKIPGLAAVVAEDESGNIVGVSWGMPASRMPEPIIGGQDKKRENVRRIAKERGIPIDSIFYFDESFVDPEYQNLQIGSRLMKARGELAKEMGCKYAVSRTINPIQVNNFKKIFGRESVEEAFQDPDDVQQDRKYYLIDLTSAKREEDA